MTGAIKHIQQTRGLPGHFIAYPTLLYRQASWSVGYFASIMPFQQVSF
jgi:hypothetical protein